MRVRYALAGFALTVVTGLVVLFGREPFVCEAARESGRAEAPPSYLLRLGAHVYRHYCETCHGKDGKGDGLNAFNLDPKPRDLTAAEFQKTRTDDVLAAVIEKGGASSGLSAAMPPWGRTLSSSERAAVLAYLRSLAPADATRGTPR